MRADRPAVPPSQAQAMSEITEQIVTMLRTSDAAGLAEYGDTVDRSDFTFEQWGDHLLGELLDAAKYLMAMRAVWRPIDTAPRRDRVLVRCESGSIYAAHWVQNPMTGDEACA